MIEYRTIPNFPGYELGSDGSCRSYWRFRGKGKGMTPVWYLSNAPTLLKPDMSSKGGPRYRLRRSEGDYSKHYVSKLLREIFSEKQGAQNAQATPVLAAKTA